MKKILYYITIALAILLPNSFCAQGATLESGFKTTQHCYGFDTEQNDGNLIFDACIEDFSEDDDSERKKAPSAQLSLNDIFLVAQNYSKNVLNKVFAAHLFYPSKTALFIFLCVFRL